VLNNSLPAVQALNAGDSLTETFTYSITDADGDSSASTLEITVNGATENDITVKLVAWDPINNIELSISQIEEGQTASYKLIATDADGNEVTNGTADINFADASINGTQGTNDFNAVNQTGVAFGTVFSAAAIDDNLNEDLENFIVSLSNVQATSYDNVVISNASVTTTIVDNDTDPTIQHITVEAIVSEEGLITGIKDTNGENAGDDSTDVTTVTGNMIFNDVDGDTLTVALSEPTETLTSNGQVITWTGDGTSNLIGSANGAEVIIIDVDATGRYVVNLVGPVDHPNNSVEDILSFDLGVAVTDGQATATATLTVTVEDDMPAASDISHDLTIPAQNTNLMIILDVSGSMDDPSGIEGKTRLEAAQDAIAELISTYGQQGDVAVRVVAFSENANAIGDVWVNANTAIAQIEGLMADGLTNYDGALADAMNAFASDGQIIGAQNVSYFFTDGVPTASDGDVHTLTDTNATRYADADEGIQAEEQIIWEAFLNDNEINSYAVGVGTGLPNNALDILNPIAYNGEGTGSDTNALVVTDFTQLTSTLNNTVSTPVTGNLLSSSDFGIGADGGLVAQVTVGGDVYSFDGTDLVKTGTNGSSFTFDNVSKTVVITTAQNSVLTVDLDGGDYSYSANPNLTVDYVETIAVELKDNDGDVVSGSLTFNVAREEIIDTNLVPESIDELQGMDFTNVNLAQDTNVVITLDVSGSMSNNNRLDLAKAALENMINTYDSMGTVNVKLVTFADKGQVITSDSGDAWMTASEAMAKINDLIDDGYTNYEDGIYETYNNYIEPNADKTVAYFISDGVPTAENIDNTQTITTTGDSESGWVDQSYLTAWTNFVNNELDAVHVVALGDGITDTTYLDELALAGGVETTVVVDPNDLNEALIPALTVDGNALDNVSGGDGLISIESITVDGINYTAATFPVTGMDIGGQGTLTFDFATGAYSYTAQSSEFTADTLKTFSVTAADIDLDTTTFDVKLFVNVDTSSSTTTVFDCDDFNSTNDGWKIASIGSTSLSAASTTTSGELCVTKDSYVEKTFTGLQAGEVVSISFDAKTSSNWEDSDQMNVFVNGNVVNIASRSNDFDSPIVFTGTADHSGSLTFQIEANTSRSSETLTIDNFEITQTDVVIPDDGLFLYGDDAESERFIIHSQEDTTLVDFDVLNDILDLSEVITDTDEEVTLNTLSEYIDFALIDSDGDGETDDTAINIDSNGESDAGGDITTVYIQDQDLTSNLESILGSDGCQVTAADMACIYALDNPVGGAEEENQPD